MGAVMGTALRAASPGPTRGAKTRFAAVLGPRGPALTLPQRSEQQGPQQPIAQRDGRCQRQALKGPLL